MIQRNFEVAMKKGAVGESIIRQHLESKGWIVYQPITDGAHCFDMMSIKGKKMAIAIDVKAKARMNKWPATGINESHFLEYYQFSIKYSMPFWVIFVDEQQKTIYGNCISELEKPRIIDGIKYPFTLKTSFGKAIHIWPLSAMKHISDLDDTQALSLDMLSQRKYEFNI